MTYWGSIKLYKANQIIVDRNTELSDKDKEIEQLKIEIEKLKDTVTKLKPSIQNTQSIIDKAYKRAQESDDEVINNLTLDQIKVLATFYNFDSNVHKSEFKNHINKNYDFSKPLVDARINELTKLELTSSDSNYYFLENKGLDIIEKLFN